MDNMAEEIKMKMIQPLNFKQKPLNQIFVDYSDAYILVTGDTKVTAFAAYTNVAFKNCAPFTRCVTHINCFRQLTSFKYKASILGKADDADGNDRSLTKIKLVVPLKYLSNFFRSLEMPLINCKIHLELNWNNDCVTYGADTYAGGDNANDRETTFQITSTKLYVPVVTLSNKDNVNLKKQSNEGFKRSLYWNEYKSKIDTKTADYNNVTRFALDASFQDVNGSFVLAIDNTENGNKKVERDSHRNYFLPRVDITNYNVLIDARNFHDQLINDQIKKYDEVRKTATGKRYDYTTGCLLDYQYFKYHYQLTAVDLSKQKELDADPRAIQQIEFYGKLETNSQVYTVLETSKETVL